MKKRPLLYLLLASILFLLPLVGCASKPAGPAAPLPPTTIELKSQLDSLTAKFNDLSGRLANLDSKVTGMGNPAALAGDISALKTSLADITTKLAGLTATLTALSGNLTALDTRLTAIETKLKGTTTTGATGTPSILTLLTDLDLAYAVNSITTRWALDAYFLDDYGSNVTVSWGLKPTKIIEGDTYRLTINIENAGTKITKAVLVIVLTPTDKTTSIDTNKTFLDSARAPYLGWESEFKPTGTVTSIQCRRITFTSDEFTILGAT